MNPFEEIVFEHINKFREEPQSIQQIIEILRRGISRLRAKDPFLNEIDEFLEELKTIKPMKKLEYNKTLSYVCKEQVLKFSQEPSSYKKYLTSNELKNILPKLYHNQNASLYADDGADYAEHAVAKFLLNKFDSERFGRTMLTNPNYSQIGIAQLHNEDDNYIILILCNEYVSDEPIVELPKDLDDSELKKAFDLLDFEDNQKLKIKDTIKLMKEMRFDVENPFLFSIIEDMASNESCSWPKFRSIAHLRMSDRKSSKGLKTIFGLFIDDPKKNTITFKTFKKISEEIGENFTDEELKDIMKRTTENGNEISYKDFLRYMKIEDDGEENDKDEE